ncbi:hypothetical protein MKEN_01454000 [Mycena kentingensis (nom. inval.)]|nr:hypothetical protein MKEN_01454000 [Mycena kentingensis (nom. inval.)]
MSRLSSSLLRPSTMFLQLCMLTALIRSTLATPSLGCTANSSWAFDATNHANQTLGNRSFWVHLPAGYNATLAHPLVLSFHGYDEDDRIHEQDTGFSKEKLLIAGKGIIAVYPLASYGPGKYGKFGKRARAWTGAPYASPEAQDLQFVLDALRALQDNLCVDKKRVYAAGMSNGGGFVNLLACTPETRAHFAAFAPVSPALYPGTLPFSPNCTLGTTRPVPLITFHGSADTVVPYAGRTAADDPPALGPAAADDITPPIADWVAGWAARNAEGCNASASELEVGVGCAAEVKAFLIENGTHRWPSTVGPNGAAYSFNATSAQIVPFFGMYTATNL